MIVFNYIHICGWLVIVHFIACFQELFPKLGKVLVVLLYQLKSCLLLPEVYYFLVCSYRLIFFVTDYVFKY